MNPTKRLPPRVVFAALGGSAAAIELSALFVDAVVLRIVGLLLTLLLTAASLLYLNWESKPASESGDLPEEPIGWRKDNRQLLGFIERVLKGCENQRISGVEIPTKSPFFVVFGVDIVSMPTDNSSDVEQAAVCEMHVCDILAEAFSHHYFWPMNIDGTLVCVVNLSVSAEISSLSEYTETTIVPVLNDAAQRLRNDGITVRIATSGLTVGTDSLSMAYQDTLEIFEQLLMCAPEEDIQVLVSNPRTSGGALIGDQIDRGQRERLYYNYVTTKDFAQAEKLLLQIGQAEAANQNFTIGLKRLISNRLEWTLDVLGGMLDHQQESHLRQMAQDITELSHYDQLVEQIHLWFETIEAYTAPRNSDQLVYHVVAYINENCYDPELSVGGISEHFSVNASYLSSTFHHQAGVRLIDYIHKQRLQKVKQLLRETNLTIAQIAESTGYYNTLSMSRAFKRYEGITPSAYRTANID